MIRLLLVDDEEGITGALKDFFQQRGFLVETANSGEDAIEIVKKTKIDIMFLDMKMRGMDGLEVLEKIKHINKDIKVIMLTILEDEGIIDKAKKLGAEEYITKPFRLDYLEEVVIKKVRGLIYGKENK